MARLSAADRRAQLLAVAREEFLRSGADGTRIRDIADRAGVNVALIYRHFDSKEELFEAAIVEPLDELASRLLAEATGLAIGDVGVTEYTYAYYQSVLRVFSETIELFGTMLFGDRETGRTFYTERIVPFIDATAATVGSNLAAWEHRPFDPAITTPMFVGMCWGAAMDAHFRGIELDVDATARIICEITFHGLGTAEAFPGRR
ncbi:TetR/AcrR family transcriptional regulator [Gordonia sp. TBRC 11910]|uniref:TetR/AcrR family transcriptional regulator n=1 Tax=Gordonia asplenii TaxID=2725283 RepID=A0A848KMT6_9ACTN|nr:TetR/AcrR family transcriptional regulator [Gordonia asplenii]NMN99985.1 TetR/AcrR family transcriptional regulator [Gordonia asplenii]